MFSVGAETSLAFRAKPGRSFGARRFGLMLFRSGVPGAWTNGRGPQRDGAGFLDYSQDMSFRIFQVSLTFNHEQNP